MRRKLFPHARSARLGLRAIVLLAGLPLAACDQLTDIEAPDALTGESLSNPEGALALRNGAIRLFYENIGSGFGAIGISALISDEVISSELALRTEIDARRVTGFGGETGWESLHTARVALHTAIAAMHEWRPTEHERIAQLFAFEAFTEVWVGETFCSGAPFSEPQGSEPVYGEPLSTSEIFERALAHFDSAIAYTDGSPAVLNLARVGRGRALANLGRFAEAAAAVSAVPTTFEYHSEHSPTAHPNNLFSGTSISRGVADAEGGNGLSFVSAADPRVPTQFANMGADGFTPMVRFLSYSAMSSPVTIASGREARLIEAEYALQEGQDSWLSILNTLRAAYDPALAPLADPGTDAERVDLLFRERAFWMYLTGHRLGDLRRLVRQYGRAADSVFPTGLYKDGRQYGTATHMTIPFSETLNPNFSACESAP